MYMLACSTMLYHTFSLNMARQAGQVHLGLISTMPNHVRVKLNTTSVHKYMTYDLVDFLNFNHPFYSKYLLKI
jgi:hypothetical protein